MTNKKYLSDIDLKKLIKRKKQGLKENNCLFDMGKQTTKKRGQRIKLGDKIFASINRAGNCYGNPRSLGDAIKQGKTHYKGLKIELLDKEE